MYLSPYDLGAKSRRRHIVQIQQSDKRRRKNIEPAVVARQGRIRKSCPDRRISDPAPCCRKDVDRQPEPQPERWMKKWQHPECKVKDSVSDKPDTPHARMVDTRDDNLPGRKFKKLAEAAFSVRRNQAFGNENDLCSLALSGSRNGVVITDRAAPCVRDSQALKSFTIQCR